MTRRTTHTTRIMTMAAAMTAILNRMKEGKKKPIVSDVHQTVQYTIYVLTWWCSRRRSWQVIHLHKKETEIVTNGICYGFDTPDTQNVGCCMVDVSFITCGNEHTVLRLVVKTKSSHTNNITEISWNENVPSQQFGFTAIKNDQPEEGKRTELTFNTDFARSWRSDGIVDVTIKDAVGKGWPFDGEDALHSGMDDIFGQCRVVEHPGEVNHLGIGFSFTNESRLSLHFTQGDGTFRFVCYAT